MFYTITNFFVSSPMKYFLHFIDIIAVAAILFFLYKLVLNTRAIAAMQGFLFIILITIAARFLNLETLYWILSHGLQVSILVIVILFQAEIRRALVIIGENTFLKKVFTYDFDYIYKISNAAFNIARKKSGALIVIQQKVPLNDILDKAISIDSLISSEILETIFYGHNPLHDGAVIVNKGRIIAASAYLPLAEGDYKVSGRRLGSRHRAGIGITEQSDAISIIVSEESSSVSIVHNGKIEYKLDRDKFNEVLKSILGVEANND